MAIAYDAAVIEKFAEALYRRAAGIVLLYGLMGFFGGGILGAFLGARSQGATGVFALIVGLVGALIGTVMARGKADALRLQAQTALCHVQIEANTRSAPIEARKVA